MLKIAIEHKDVFIQLKQQEKKYNALPSDEEWKPAIEVCDMLKLFQYITKLFSGSKYPTANLFFPIKCESKLSFARTRI